MKGLYRFYRIINTLSLDVAAGAIVAAWFFGCILEVHILPYAFAALAVTVWIIYTADHLSDAKKIQGQASSHRHSFHQRYFNSILAILCFAIIADIILLFFIRRPVFIWGLYLIGGVVLYLALHRTLFFLKEVFVAILYSLGVLLPSLAVTEVPITSLHAGVFAQFFLIVLINLLVFSWYDAERDISDNLSSFVTWLGKRAAKKFIGFLFALFFVGNLGQLIFFERNNGLPVLLLMGLTLLVVFLFPKFFGKSEYYRMLGDAVFFFPALVLL